MIIRVKETERYSVLRAMPESGKMEMLEAGSRRMK